MQKVTCHQPICLLLHAILSGVGVPRKAIPHVTYPEGEKMLTWILICS